MTECRSWGSVLKNYHIQQCFLDEIKPHIWWCDETLQVCAALGVHLGVAVEFVFAFFHPSTGFGLNAA